MVACLFQQALGHGGIRTRRGNEEHLIKGILAHAGHGGTVFFLGLSRQAAFQCGEEGLGSFFLCQADDSAQVAHLGHVQDAEQGNGLLRGAAGIQHHQRALGKDPDAAAVFHSGQTFQNSFIGDVIALFAESQGQLHRNGGTARRVTAQEGQRHGIAAVVHTAGKLFGFEEGDIIGVRHDQLTVCLTGGHDELTDHSLGLLRRCDADAALAHDTGRQRGGALQ